MVVDALAGFLGPFAAEQGYKVKATCLITGDHYIGRFSGE